MRCAAFLSNARDDLVQQVGISGQKRHGGAARGQRFRHLTAQSFAGPGNDSDMTIESFTQDNILLRRRAQDTKGSAGGSPVPPPDYCK